MLAFITYFSFIFLKEDIHLDSYKYENIYTQIHRIKLFSYKVELPKQL